MSRPKLPISDTVRGEIHAELLKYSTTHNVIPNAHSFFENVMKPAGYSMTYSTFRDHWKDLMLDGLIRTDPTTGAIDVKGLKVSELED